jgi:hypothetical protein
MAMLWRAKRPLSLQVTRWEGGYSVKVPGTSQAVTRPDELSTSLLRVIWLLGESAISKLEARILNGADDV